jgi:hypothetical protein
VTTLRVARGDETGVTPYFGASCDGPLSMPPEDTPLPKRFNTAGPCRGDWHYMVPPLPRLPQARGHVEKGDYFVLHAPRQSGKTTFLRHFARALTAEATFCALYMSCEAAEACGDDARAAQEVIVRRLLQEADQQLPESLQPQPPVDYRAEGVLTEVVKAWCERCPRKVVLFLDEIDAVRGQSLIAVLRQRNRPRKHGPGNTGCLTRARPLAAIVGDVYAPSFEPVG